MAAEVMELEELSLSPSRPGSVFYLPLGIRFRRRLLHSYSLTLPRYALSYFLKLQDREVEQRGRNICENLSPILVLSLHLISGISHRRTSNSLNPSQRWCQHQHESKGFLPYSVGYRIWYALLVERARSAILSTHARCGGHLHHLESVMRSYNTGSAIKHSICCPLSNDIRRSLQYGRCEN